MQRERSRISNHIKILLYSGGEDLEFYVQRENRAMPLTDLNSVLYENIRKMVIIDYSSAVLIHKFFVLLSSLQILDDFFSLINSSAVLCYS